MGSKNESPSDLLIERLKKVRNDRGFSQEYVADKLDTSVTSYQRLEAGKVKITVDRLLQLSSILNVSFKYFVDDFIDDEVETSTLNDEQVPYDKKSSRKILIELEVDDELDKILRDKVKEQYSS
ncbi:helix-turn-helix domain-containing protein [Salibacter halophilus]|uniref:Helix-turn-helix transcriptional regulator n=1 Tax=Salibacter halophilus TaxID=1803916 RepID=A0A6N6M3J7_9FLAO|nr:helix-turn-helix transcriptional regulator [Salibacter halophilus]KAB1061977.1 helix-turn-helix transcriptional regulator [Salibacter halophilus]